MQSLLKKLCDDLNLTPPKKQKNNYFLIDINDDIKISFLQHDLGIFLSAPITLCPQKNKEEIFLKLMKANLLAKTTGKAAIGLDEKEKYLTLSLLIPYEIKYDAFKEKLEEFANFIEYWKNEIEKFKQVKS